MQKAIGKLQLAIHQTKEQQEKPIPVAFNRQKCEQD
jgi:hypothetical protein